MNWNDYIQLGLLTVGLLTLLFYFYKYLRNQNKSSLDDELENLTQAFAVKELTNPKYKYKTIEYPSNLICTNELCDKCRKQEKTAFRLNNKLSVYDNFYEYVKCASLYIPDTEFSHRQMIVLYNKFTNNLVHRDRLDLTFQILYTCIDGIVSSWSTNRYKRKQLSRVQNCLTSKQLIYYFFNQIQYADRQRRVNKYLIMLYEFDFFHKMFESDAYREIKNQIQISVEKLVYKQIKK